MSNCLQTPGVVKPVIDRDRCDGKADCVDVCPYNVFELGIMPPEQRTGLGFMTHVRGALNGWKQSFAVRAEACRACGLCVSACPEKAIRLQRD
ncbi:ferredoxin family protein [Asticcacaulis sp. AC402]|uniref:4Fe-4S dicluster domain-containing protein n=1 Tax=Asticcacaulis sp. AC402 TaxID=1282361 RepID=UPI0003C3D620|nr:4Fe-4S dicluster domain-containing protein [Asticcacaulis sp. AC402]ESQ76177.1 4Fe-4S ferredoxin [Asticcacaulis sp. AC402]